MGGEEGYPGEGVGARRCALEIDRDPGANRIFLSFSKTRSIPEKPVRSLLRASSLPYYRTGKSALTCAFPQFPCTSPMHVDLMKRLCEDEVGMLPTSPWKVCSLLYLHATSPSLMSLFDTEIALRRCGQMNCLQQHNTDSPHQGLACRTHTRLWHGMKAMGCGRVACNCKGDNDCPTTHLQQRAQLVWRNRYVYHTTLSPYFSFSCLL